MAELYAMQQVEATGFHRLEQYLAQILAALINQHSGKPYDWRKHLIGWHLHRETPEQMFAKMQSFTARWKNGSDSQPRRESGSEDRQV